jgi:hypothetical protein
MVTQHCGRLLFCRSPRGDRTAVFAGAAGGAGRRAVHRAAHEGRRQGKRRGRGLEVRVHGAGQVLPVGVHDGVHHRHVLHHLPGAVAVRHARPHRPDALRDPLRQEPLPATAPPPRQARGHALTRFPQLFVPFLAFKPTTKQPTNVSWNALCLF